MSTTAAIGALVLYITLFYREMRFRKYERVQLRTLLLVQMLVNWAERPHDRKEDTSE